MLRMNDIHISSCLSEPRIPLLFNRCPGASFGYTLSLMTIIELRQISPLEFKFCSLWASTPRLGCWLRAHATFWCEQKRAFRSGSSSKGGLCWVQAALQGLG